MSNYTLDLSSCELYHHGVKGQKHGVRNYQYKDGSLTPEGYIHYGYGKRNKKGDIVLTRTGKAYEERRKSGIDVSSRMVGEAREQRNAVNTVAPTLRYTNELALQTTEKAKKLSASRVLGSSAAGSAAALVTTVLTANPLLGGAAGALIGGATRSSILDKQVDKTAELKALRDKGMHHLLDLKSDSMVKDKEYTDLMKLYKAKKNYIQGGGSEEFARNITDPNKVKLDNQGRVTNVNMNLTPYRKQKKNVKHSAILDLSSGELYHTGVLGMRWGYRRYQNPDGSLTPLGEIHYGRKMAKLDKKKLKILKKTKKMEERDARTKAKIEVHKQKELNKAKHKSLIKTALLNRQDRKQKEWEKANKAQDNKKDSKQQRKEKAKKKVAKMMANNDKQAKKLKYKDFEDITKITEKGESRAHDGIDRLYRDKYVLDGQTKLKTRKFKRMSTKDLNDYISRYSAETRYLGEKEKRSSYDINARTLKRTTSHVASMVVLAVGVKAVKSILSN